MHIILGGAYNGKRNYVEQLISQRESKQLVRCEGVLPNIEEATSEKRFMISNFEKLVTPYLHLPEEEAAKQIVDHILLLNDISEVFCVCTDMSRGVVPLEKEARQLRDTCGRVYQKLCQHAKTVERVWYGIPQQLKGELDRE